VLDFYASIRPGPARRAADVLRFTGLNGAGARPVATYSGGIRQRLALAVALLPDAAVLLLDEPTASLEQDGLEAFYRLIDAKRTHGQTVLLSSHQMGDVERLADRFLVLVGGSLTATLTARELSDRLSAPGTMRLLLDRWPEGLLDRVRETAPRAERAGDELVVGGRA
jgi:ABC-type multidrug transport system ATPase subunit